MMLKEAIYCLCICISLHKAHGIFVDQGNPYENGPLHVGGMTITKSMHNSSIHTRVFYPLEKDDYSVLIFIGGFNSWLMTEFYETFLSKLAAHGFFIFGLDLHFPLYNHMTDSFRIKPLTNLKEDYAQDVLEHIKWLRNFMPNQTVSNVQWNYMGLLCHSAGCDTTLQMTLKNRTLFKSTAFLEPMSFNANTNMTFKMPAIMYGTQFSEEGITKCCLKGMDWNQFYSIWKCPRNVMEVANFGHCDILDSLPWSICHESHFCKTTNDTRLAEYRQFAQGVCASFLVSTVQGRPDVLSYVADRDKIPLPLVEFKTDLTC